MRKFLMYAFVLMMAVFMTGVSPITLLAQQVSENEPGKTQEVSANEVSEAQAVSGNAVTTDLGLSTPSYLLMEASTGTVIAGKNENEVLRPASITKIMTMILIFDALQEGKIKPEEEVSVSEYAASMGGSQVFLEAGEKQTVDTMLKCIAVASANDACASFG